MGGKKSKYDSQKHNRQSTRLRGYDYTQSGAYFVTMVTYQRECLFGEILEGEMRLNRAGKIAQWEWQNLPQRFQFIELGAFVVMPNHVHGILIFHREGATQPAQKMINSSDDSLQETKETSADGSPRPCGPKPGSLGAIVGQFKSRVTKRIWKMPSWRGRPIWQRNYHDRIIRNRRELDAIWRYIETNPANWSVDNENPRPCEK
jgi:REP element-mobilizing transposase RayT